MILDPFPSPADRYQTPTAVEDAFYEAFARLDLTLMVALWLPGERAVCIHPGGQLLRGSDEVLDGWRSIFNGAQPPIVEYRRIDAFSSETLTVHLVEERIRPHQAPAEAANRLIATNVFLRQEGRWYLAEHHGSLPLIRPPRRELEPEKPRLH